jgi:hypothetical protein
MRDGLRAIHGADPGEDEPAADAACGQPIAGPGGDGKYDHRATKATSGMAASDHTTYCGQSSAARPLDKGTSKATLRVFVCNSCSTAEVVPWCGQSPDCGHPECAEALADYAATHRVDDRRFHGQVNVAIVERHLWDRYQETVAVETRRSRPGT